jgi:hypothetical protein
MTRYAHSYSRIAAALLALTAACGSGRPAPASKFGGIRMQDPAELDTENGLVAISLNDACLMLDMATAPAPTDGTLAAPTDPTAATAPTDPTAATAPTDPTASTAPTDPTLTAPTLTDPTAVNTNTCSGNMNGMPPNLLGLQGLRPNSLTDDHFKRWFAADPKSANLLMKYLVKCSLPADLGMSFDYGGITYLWPGAVGLAPHWAQGEPIPESEQQLVSACLGAHANRYGAHVAISILGNYADGSAIPVGDSELSTYPVTEGCFFGNLFRKDGLFSANDRPLELTDDQSSVRACAMPDRTGSGASSMCSPIQYAGNCRDLCQPDPSNLYYLTCSTNGRTYRALSTRIQRNADYTCGDGICQVSESCGTGSTWNDCGLDCGPCN